MADSRVLFKRDVICRHYEISKVLFYKLARIKDGPLKRIEGVWCCNMDEMAEFVRKYAQEK